MIEESSSNKRFGCCKDNECGLYEKICPIGKTIVLKGACDRETEGNCCGRLGR